MQSELKLVKEFRRKRALMQKEIDDVSSFTLHEIYLEIGIKKSQPYLF